MDLELIYAIKAKPLVSAGKGPQQYSVYAIKSVFNCLQRKKPQGSLQFFILGMSTLSSNKMTNISNNSVPCMLC
jgi:hypothetical protein